MKHLRGTLSLVVMWTTRAAAGDRPTWRYDAVRSAASPVVASGTEGKEHKK